MESAPRRRYRTPVFDSTYWDSFQPRADDIILSTLPKGGTTWVQRIAACLVLGDTSLPVSLERMSPWLDHKHNEVDLATTLADLEAQRHRRVIKTHLPADALPELPSSVSYLVVVRDLRDIALSYHNHLTMGKEITNPRARDPRVFWQAFFAGRRMDRAGIMALPVFLDHLTSWWPLRDREGVLLLHYTELLQDLEGQMRRVAAHLGLEVPQETWPSLLDACRFESMRSESSRVLPALGSAKRSADFFHSGKTGRWRDIATEEDLELYEKAVASLPQDLRAWLEQ